MNSPGISVLVEGAVTSAARLIVVLFVVVWAHVKDGEQTALPSQFDFCTLSVRILTLPSIRRHSVLPSHDCFTMSCESRLSQWLVEYISYLMFRWRSFDEASLLSLLLLLLL